MSHDFDGMCQYCGYKKVNGMCECEADTPNIDDVDPHDMYPDEDEYEADNYLEEMYDEFDDPASYIDELY